MSNVFADNAARYTNNPLMFYALSWLAYQTQKSEAACNTSGDLINTLSLNTNELSITDF